MKQIDKLKQQIAEMLEAIEQLNKESKFIADRREDKQKLLKEYRDKLWLLENPIGIKVIDHALLRYLERVKNMKTSDITLQIAKSIRESSKLSGKIPDGKYYCGDFRAIVKDNQVITIY